MRACWRGLSPRCIWDFVYLGACDVSRSPLDTFGDPKCELGLGGGRVKIPPGSRGFRLRSRSFRAEVSGQTERYCGLSSERTRAQRPSRSLLPAVLCIIIHSSLQPQTPSSHHLSCCCHSDFESDLSFACPPVKCTASIGGGGHFVFTLWEERDTNRCGASKSECNSPDWFCGQLKGLKDGIRINKTSYFNSVLYSESSKYPVPKSAAQVGLLLLRAGRNKQHHYTL